MDEFLLKYNRLNRFSQKQIMDFLDFLLGKQVKKGDSFDHQNYKNKLLKVSTWSDADIEEINQSTKKTSWEIDQW